MICNVTLARQKISAQKFVTLKICKCLLCGVIFHANYHSFFYVKKKQRKGQGSISSHSPLQVLLTIGNQILPLSPKLVYALEFLLP